MAQAHCNSYYAASVNTVTDYPALAGDHRTDVCVIGAGFTGIATALTLAERGYQVTVMEQNRVGWGASGRNGGQMIGGFTGEDRMLKVLGSEYQDLIFKMGYRGHDIIAERVRKYDIQCDLKYGYMDVAFKQRHMRSFEQHYEHLQNYGFGDDIRLVSRDQMGDVLGTDAYIGGLINHRNGHLHPLNLCLGEARAAASLGVKIFEQTQVLDIQHGSSPQVITAKGTVRADAVVLAGNAYHHLEQQSMSGLIFPAGSYIIATEPLSEEEARQLNPMDMAVCDANEVLDYYRLSQDRRLLFGGRCNYSGREPASIKATMLPRMLKVFPQLRGKKIDYEWGGNIGIVVNRVPLLGRVPGSDLTGPGRRSDNVFYAMGYSGHGVNTTHLAGEIMADAIAGTFERLDVFEKMKHSRIPFGRQFGSYMVALGMMYFRLMDLR